MESVTLSHIYDMLKLRSDALGLSVTLHDTVVELKVRYQLNPNALTIHVSESDREFVQVTLVYHGKELALSRIHLHYQWMGYKIMDHIKLINDGKISDLVIAPLLLENSISPNYEFDSENIHKYVNLLLLFHGGECILNKDNSIMINHYGRKKNVNGTISVLEKVATIKLKTNKNSELNIIRSTTACVSYEQIYDLIISHIVMD
jgi:hypothetical protein